MKAEAWQVLAIAECELVTLSDTCVPSWQGSSASSLVFRGRLTFKQLAVMHFCSQCYDFFPPET